MMIVPDVRKSVRLNHPRSDTTTTRRRFTWGIWIVSLVALSIAGLIASAFVLMAFGLDPGDIISAGSEPWINALLATLLFIGLAIVTGFSLWLWHFTRFRGLALMTTAAEVGGVAWACLVFYRDYF